MVKMELKNQFTRLRIEEIEKRIKERNKKLENIKKDMLYKNEIDKNRICKIKEGIGESKRRIEDEAGDSHKKVHKELRERIAYNHKAEYLKKWRKKRREKK